MRDVNKSLQFEVDDLKQKLKDANGDIKVGLYGHFYQYIIYVHACCVFGN
jgi:hypothetical protein